LKHDLGDFWRLPTLRSLAIACSVQTHDRPAIWLQCTIDGDKHFYFDMSSVAGLNAGASRPVSRSRPSSSTAPVRPSSAAGILTPTNDAVLNRARIQNRQSLPGLGLDNSGSGKRKRDVAAPALAADSLLKAPIVLKVCPTFFCSGGDREDKARLTGY
jgi:hypothetical protein